MLEEPKTHAHDDAQERLDDDGAPRRRRRPRLSLARIDRSASVLCLAASWNEQR